MSILYTFIYTLIAVYLLGWLKYLWPTVPFRGKKEYYQNRLDILRRLLVELKQAGDTYFDSGIVGLMSYLQPGTGYKKPDTIEVEFPFEFWPQLSKHIEYTVNKYRKISKFQVMVVDGGPAGMNVPFLPGLIVADFAFMNVDLGFACDIFLHEAYHDFYIGHGKRVKSIDGMRDIDIPLRRGLAEPVDLFGVVKAGAFNKFVDLLRAYSDDHNDSLWTVICRRAS